VIFGAPSFIELAHIGVLRQARYLLAFRRGIFFLPMKTSYVHGKMLRSSPPDSARQDQGDLKQQIKNFLSAASSKPQFRAVCPRCGKPMQYVDTFFSLYGAEGTWKVRLPVCVCATKIQNGETVENCLGNKALSR
jgi:hypothetical protein